MGNRPGGSGFYGAYLIGRVAVRTEEVDRGFNRGRFQHQHVADAHVETAFIISFRVATEFHNI